MSDVEHGRAEPVGEIGLWGRLSLLLVVPLSALAQGGLSPILPKLSEHFAGTPGADVLVRMLVSSVPAAMIVGSLLGGVLSDRFGQRRVLLSALALYTGAGMSGYVLDNLSALLVSRIVLGIANAAAGVIVAAMITTRFPHELRDRWLGFLVTAGTVSAIAIIIAVGALGEFNWRLIFLLHGMAILAILAILLLVHGDEPSAARRKSAARGKFPWVFAVLGIALGAMTTLGTIFLPFHLAKIGETSTQRIAHAIIPTALVGGIVSFCYGWIRARCSTITAFAVAFGAGALGIATVVLSGTYGGALIGMVLVGCGLGLSAPNLMAAAADATPLERRSSVIGIVRASTSAGPLLTQLALEPIFLGYGIDSVLWVLSSVLSLVTVAVLLRPRWLLPTQSSAPALPH